MKYNRCWIEYYLASNYRNMKTLLSSFAIFFIVISMKAQTCSPNGNVMVYSNYDGGVLTINCDLNIPNMKIGICTYEAVEVHITGPYVGNVTEVLYAGYIGENDNCGQGVTNTTISGVAPGITDILFAPPVTFTDANGYPFIICGYSCGTGNQGGCNTSIQIAEYFTDTFVGTLFLFDSQYNCWNDETVSLSQGGSCCPSAILVPQAFFSSNDQLLCLGQCINFFDESSGVPTSWSWTFAGATTSTSGAQNPANICFLNAGTYPVTLTASSTNGSTTYSSNIEVISCGVPGCTYPQATNYNPAATVDNGNCGFPVCNNDCPADLNDDGVVGITDLLSFIGVYGTVCP